MGDDTCIDRAIELLREARHTVALTGAGISTPSGIPDYRSPKSGLWEKAADMVEVATLVAFRRHPLAFYDWLRPLLHIIREAQPNPAHLALAQLEAVGRLQAIITQNIDLLHSRAGSRSVFEIHGHLREVVCPACHTVIPGEPLLEAFLATGKVPHCPRCRHIMKPSVVLFGELLPWREMKAAKRHTAAADLIVVAGSSLEVSPAADLPEMALNNGAHLIIINYNETHLDHRADVVIRADVAEVLPQLAEPFRPRPAPIDSPEGLHLGDVGKIPPSGDVRIEK